MCEEEYFLVRLQSDTIINGMVLLSQVRVIPINGMKNFFMSGIEYSNCQSKFLRVCP